MVNCNQPTVSVELGDLIVKLHNQLRKEFGLDFAYCIVINGSIAAASNLRDGLVEPRTTNKDD